MRDHYRMLARYKNDSYEFECEHDRNQNKWVDFGKMSIRMMWTRTQHKKYNGQSDTHVGRIVANRSKSLGININTYRERVWNASVYVRRTQETVLIYGNKIWIIDWKDSHSNCFFGSLCSILSNHLMLLFFFLHFIWVPMYTFISESKLMQSSIFDRIRRATKP